MKDAFDGSSQDDNAFGGPSSEQPAEPLAPELERKRQALNDCVARHYEELMTAARGWLGSKLRQQLGPKAFEARSREAVHTAYLRASKPDKLAVFDPDRGDPRKWLFRFIHTITSRERKTRQAREHKHQTNVKRATITSISRLASTDQRHLPQDDQFALQARFDGEADDYLPEDVRDELAKGDTSRLLRLLSDQDADLLKQNVIEGKTYEEIAAETGEKASTLRKRAERARAKLRYLDGGPTA